MKIAVLCVMLVMSFSCSKRSSQFTQLKEELHQVKLENRRLQQELDSITKKHLEPFKMYEEILIAENETAPDSIILQYEKLIEKYPNSYWAHESRKRKENVEERRDFWQNGKWVFPNNSSSKNSLVIPPIISCPGC